LRGQRGTEIGFWLSRNTRKGTEEGGSIIDFSYKKPRGNRGWQGKFITAMGTKRISENTNEKYLCPSGRLLVTVIEKKKTTYG